MSTGPIRPALTLIASLASTLLAQYSNRIRLNQIGYVVGQPKIAVSLDLSDEAYLVDSARGTVVATLAPDPVDTWEEAMDTCRVIDFSAIEVPGTYFLKIGRETSHPIRISANPFESLTKGSIKAFWYNRSSFALPARFAGPWARSMGHPDNKVIIHPSAASLKRPAGSTINSPGGWYDAGDYGKYVVNSGITTWTLLHLYETNPGYFDTLQLWLPTRTSVRSDLVDEILWNLRWMLSMQDPEDGGVYHKLTTLNFNAVEMPVKDQADRYVFKKSTAASLDLAAVSAYAARLFQRIPSLRPLADSCLQASLAAWAWARANPKANYSQGTINNRFPDLPVVTGEYGDGSAVDERYWAASELFLTTQADSFAMIDTLSKKALTGRWATPSWSYVSTLGWLSLQSNPSLLTGSLTGISPRLDSVLCASVKSIRDYRTLNGYRLIQNGYYWGSNSVIANNSLMLWKAWEASSDTSYRNASLVGLDYLLGRNATGYSFVTGFGSKTPMRPHHRPSGADGVTAPVPGFLVGGPNGSAYNSDKATGYISTTIDPKQYADNQESYASNEVAINWNAPLAYLAGVWSAHLSAPASTGIAARSSTRLLNLELTARQGHLTASLPGHELVRLELISLDGKILAHRQGKASTLTLESQAHGLFVVRALSSDGLVAMSRLMLP